jgi:hypothetical protein
MDVWRARQELAALPLFDKMLKEHPTRKLVSVGCGMCYEENNFMLSFSIPRGRMIMVDPNPTSYVAPDDRASAIPYLSIDYPTVDHLIKASPEIVGNCILMLWNSDIGYNVYDLHAVRNLCPLNILIATDLNYSISSYVIQSWFDSLGIKLPRNHSGRRNFVDKPERWFPSKGSYKIAEQIDWRHQEKNPKDTIGHFCILRISKSADAPDTNTFDMDFSLFKKENEKNLQNEQRLTKFSEMLMTNFGLNGNDLMSIAANMLKS